MGHVVGLKPFWFIWLSRLIGFGSFLGFAGIRLLGLMMFWGFFGR